MKSYLTTTIGILVLLIFVLFFISCAPISGSITTQTHPDSKIVHMLDAAGLDAESTGRTIAEIVVMEIQLGKFTKTETTEFIEKRISIIEEGITYYQFVSVIETYGKLLLEQKTNTTISNVAMVGYMLVKNRLNYGKLNFNAIKIKIGLVDQDKDIVLRLLRHVLSQVKLYT